MPDVGANYASRSVFCVLCSSVNVFQRECAALPMRAQTGERRESPRENGMMTESYRFIAPRQVLEYA